MQNTSLIKILKCLSTNEIIELKKFLRSHYFNRNRNCEKLFAILCQYHPEFNSTKLAAEKVFYRVFSKEKSYQKNEANFRTLRSQLKKCIDQFLVLKELEKDQSKKKLLLMDAYTNRGVATSLILGLTKKIHQEETVVSTWYYLNHFLLHWKLYQEDIKSFFNVKTNSFEGLNKNLDYFYALTKLKIGIEQTNLVKRNLDISPIDLLPNIQAYIQANAEDLPIELILYAKLYDLMNDQLQKTDDFKVIFQLFQSIIDTLAKEEAREIAIVLYNYSNTIVTYNNAFLIDNGSIESYKEWRFEVLQLGVKHNLYLENGIFLSSTFMNIAACAASVSKFKWAFTFIDEYREFLPPVSKEMNLNATKAIVYYLQANVSKNALDYKKSIHFFEATKTRSIPYNKRKMRLLLRIHYEHFVLAGDMKIFKYLENFHVSINRFKGFTTAEKRALLNTNNTVKFLAKSRHDPNLSLETVKNRMAKFKTLDYYRPKWVIAQIKAFLAFRFPNEVFESLY